MTGWNLIRLWGFLFLLTIVLSVTASCSGGGGGSSSGPPVTASVSDPPAGSPLSQATEAAKAAEEEAAAAAEEEKAKAAATAALATGFPGGFIENATSTVVRPVTTPSQIQSFLPAERGPFIFPAPYNTAGIRLTHAGDCKGGDCVESVGYAYWRNINNHVGSNTLYAFLGMNQGKGGAGPSLFSVDKTTNAVTNLGPLFGAGDPLGGRTGEGWYFSATQPTKLYAFDGPRLYRYDVVTKQKEVVFDVSVNYGSDKTIWQIHSSNDDKVHSATLRTTANAEMLGCIVYFEATQQYQYYPKTGVFDECHVDKSGKWLVSLENTTGTNGLDNIIINLQTNARTVLLDKDGAALAEKLADALGNLTPDDRVQHRVGPGGGMGGVGSEGRNAAAHYITFGDVIAGGASAETVARRMNGLQQTLTLSNPPAVFLAPVEKRP